MTITNVTSHVSTGNSSIGHSQLEKRSPAEKIKAAFDRRDTNQDGNVSFDEVSAYFNEYIEKEKAKGNSIESHISGRDKFIAQLFKFDTSKDKQLSLEEFSSAMQASKAANDRMQAEMIKENAYGDEKHQPDFEKRLEIYGTFEKENEYLRHLAPTLVGSI